jgi:hypothetical protein
MAFCSSVFFRSFLVLRSADRRVSKDVIDLLSSFETAARAASSG